ncbi:hypothetical protein DFP93_13239 [Aneurinibacillus soli]|uniref:Uncharacterized protein n=1 Tax=Aneurinibacillus soli TaxID=1500254 RepID=A0A0U5BE85_9BACL|nr:hypothetical protein [Aneurinibacillus soli]PYE57280.1 hypothetical protein DFP93_13239 [Aneurinibacillus soli]BAU29276.1 hypothetical protein CB4_03463 [Aneurinibacillus soli]
MLTVEAIAYLVLMTVLLLGAIALFFWYKKILGSKEKKRAK